MAGTGRKFALVSIILLLIVLILTFLVLLVIYWQRYLNLQSSGIPPCASTFCGSGEYVPTV